MKKRIYLDNAATTRVDPEVARTIYNTMLDVYGNPSGKYYEGEIAKEIVEGAQNAAMDFLGAFNGRVIFTASGSEANNIAVAVTVFGVRGFYTDPIEHKSISRLTDDYKVKIDDNGIVDLDALEDVLADAEPKSLVSIQYANNEIGTIQPIEDIVNIVHTYGCYLHCDCTQALYLCRDVIKDYEIDILTTSFHKWHCPKGIGMIYIGDHVDIKPELAPILGGQQGYGIRPGTENIPYIAGVKYMFDHFDTINNKQRLYQLGVKRDYLFSRIKREIEDIKVNGPSSNSPFTTSRLTNNLNISFKNVDAEGLLAMLDADGICVSAGSACNSESFDPSHVLKAIHVPNEYIFGAIRFTVGDDVDFKDLNYVVECLKKHVKTLRELTAEMNGEVVVPLG